MTSFSEMNISQENNHFVGNKVSILDILNEIIEVHSYKIVKSKLPADKGSGRCLHLQIAKDNTKYVVFSGSENLMSQIDRVPKDKFPFSVTIRKKERLLYFS